ncbi:hypothetical protein [Paenibacillus apis]|uniref:hypothetical protein n=1 Tax=Paenibacillus apis TaxID=1792174 RepID=UPI0026588657|nr:hypothetical protein [Paenibacillus apis]
MTEVQKVIKIAGVGAHATIIVQKVIKIAGVGAHATIIVQKVIKIAGVGAHATIIVQKVIKISGVGAGTTIIVQKVIKIAGVNAGATIIVQKVIKIAGVGAGATIIVQKVIKNFRSGCWSGRSCGDYSAESHQNCRSRCSCDESGEKALTSWSKREVMAGSGSNKKAEEFSEYQRLAPRLFYIFFTRLFEVYSCGSTQ